MPKALVFKPHIDCNTELPTSFEELVVAQEDDVEIQKKPCVWFTRSYPNVRYNESEGAVEMGVDEPTNLLYQGAFEITVPKEYFCGKETVEIDLQGWGWLSVKLIESTVTGGGVRTEWGGSWKKLDTVREKELLFFRDKRAVVRINLSDFRVKPLNVSLRAFLRGLIRPLRKDRIVSVEITVRRGRFLIHSFTCT